MLSTSPKDKRQRENERERERQRKNFDYVNSNRSRTTVISGSSQSVSGCQLCLSSRWSISVGWERRHSIETISLNVITAEPQVMPRINLIGFFKFNGLLFFCSKEKEENRLLSVVSSSLRKVAGRKRMLLCMFWKASYNSLSLSLPSRSSSFSCSSLAHSFPFLSPAISLLCTHDTRIFNNRSWTSHASERATSVCHSFSSLSSSSSSSSEVLFSARKELFLLPRCWLSSCESNEWIFSFLLSVYWFLSINIPQKDFIPNVHPVTAKKSSLAAKVESPSFD